MIEPISGGIFDDNGNKTDPHSIPMPSLCVICKHHSEDDREEQILCNLNRFDQRNEPKFKCHQFDKV